MNLFGLSPGELVLIMFVAMIVLGPEKLPETAASIGKWIREFRRATQELTQQFADENPFAEIQRSLNFNEEPVAPPTPPVLVDAGPVDAVAVPTTPVYEAPPTYQPAVVSAPVAPRSDFFDRPALFDPIEDRWAHGSVEDFSERVLRRLKPQIEQAIADEWAHGVPVAAVVAPVEPIASNGHTSDAANDWINSLNFAGSLNSAGASSDADSIAESSSDPIVAEGEAETDVKAAELVDAATDNISVIVEAPPAPPTHGISLSSVMVRESEPVAVGSTSSNGSSEDESLR